MKSTIIYTLSASEILASQNPDYRGQTPDNVETYYCESDDGREVTLTTDEREDFERDAEKTLTEDTLSAETFAELLAWLERDGLIRPDAVAQPARAAHTPGPWTIKKASPQAGIITAPNRGLGVAEVFGGGETDLANARLIAAAPELAEVAEYVACMMRDLYSAPDSLQSLAGKDPAVRAWLANERGAALTAEAKARAALAKL